MTSTQSSGEGVRAFYASEIQAVANLKSDRLVAALARIPRERFLGPGPWQVYAGDVGMGGGTYYTTPDADPARVYHNVVVALDASRLLNNGLPSLGAAWIEALAIRPGARIAHIGCATGYFTALIAEVSAPLGSVTAFEIDDGLAARAKENLAPWQHVSVERDGTALSGQYDAILVSAGVTHPLPNWLDALKPGGRLLVPLTTDMGGGTIGKGWMLKIEQTERHFAARFGGIVAIYHCTGARSAAMVPLLQKAFTSWGFAEVKRLRRDQHLADSGCWLHADTWCLSKQ